MMATMQKAMRRLTKSSLIWPIVILLLMLAYNLIRDPRFFSIRITDGHLYGSLIDILRNGAPLIIIAIGMTLVIATRGIDLSVGSVAAVSGAMACTFIQKGLGDPSSSTTALTAMAIAMGIGLVMGIMNGFLVSVVKIQPIIATLVLMTAGRGIAMLITDGSANVSVRGNDTFKLIGGGYWATIPISILVATVVFIAIALLTRKTALGMLIESVGINPEASRLAGVGSRPILWVVYVFSALCAAVAGLMITSNVSAADPNNDALFIEMDAILAVVIGGTSLSGGKYSLTGTLFGALIIQTLTTTIYSAGIPPEVTMVYKAIVVIAICLLQSEAMRSLMRRRKASSLAAKVSVQEVSA